MEHRAEGIFKWCSCELHHLSENNEFGFTVFEQKIEFERIIIFFQ